MGLWGLMLICALEKKSIGLGAALRRFNQLTLVDVIGAGPALAGPWAAAPPEYISTSIECEELATTSTLLSVVMPSLCSGKMRT